MDPNTQQNTTADVNYAMAYGPSDQGGFAQTNQENAAAEADFKRREQEAAAQFTLLVNQGMPPDQAMEQSGVNAIRREGEFRSQQHVDPNKNNEIQNSIMYQGTPWESFGYDPQGNSNFLGGNRQPNYMYGRDPNAANQAVAKAWGTGDAAQVFGQGVAQTGSDLLQQRTNDATYFQGRGPQYGDFGSQNQTLGQLGGLEATQGPSAAQAQLQQGTNQAMASQLALARSGRGFGGNAAAMGQAQGNMAQIMGAQATSAAQLRAQEDAAWRARQAANLGTVAGAQGQQAQANLGAYYQNQGQNDAAALQALGLGQQGYFQGADAGARGYEQNLQAQGLANQIRGQEMTGSLAMEDNILREWAARNGYNLSQQQRQDQKEAGYINMGTSFLSNLISQ